MSVRVESASDMGPLERAYVEILAPSFPASELTPRSAFLAQARSGELVALVAWIDDVPCGVIVGERAGSTMLIAWLAVRADLRGRGVGSALLDAGKEEWMRSPDVELVLAELERPDMHVADEAFGDPRRRIRFYAGHGAAALDLPYYQPSITEGMPRVRGLILALVASRTTAATTATPRMLEAVEAAAVRSYLLETFGSPADADAETARIHTAAGAQEGIRLVALDDYREIPV
ncbi:GNAT family N-acetyltransferase [Microbacterium murale]|uniref:N-acetyltransferase domain-containing protein n=1 Tax=Microbacterium murale TaxID=1081040 RepID=A0ABQ1RU68_9MICO|nr:GNAT family N-acetyltransferase [Microbacterium murale]GGD79498.1 hypothetical protein GCM10007269_22950 [Microbacterium murale]